MNKTLIRKIAVVVVLLVAFAILAIALPGEHNLKCDECGGTGMVDGQVCSTCHGEGWIELLGAGMVHPTVLENCGIDPEKYSGFAFGIGLERTAMGRLKINDLRLIFDNDVRFLNQF